MTIVRSFPGRIRFSADSEQVLSIIGEQLKNKLGERADGIELRYSARSRRGLATFTPDRAFTDRVAGVLEAVLGPSDPAPAPPGENAACGGTAQWLPAPVRNAIEPGGIEHPVWVIGKKVAAFYMTRAFMPATIRPYWTVFSVAPLILAGVKSLFRGKVDVSVLDAAAVGSALAMRDFNTAGTINLLLDIAETLEEMTHEKSRKDLESLFQGDGKPVWVREEGREVQVLPGDLNSGDLVVVRSGSRIPVDGVVSEGTAMVNQSSMTGEPLAVKRGPGKSVFAGTVVEEGKIVIHSEGVGEDTRFAKIAQTISDSETMKAEIHGQAIQLADRIVPFSFILSGVVFAFTRNWMQAASVLMADYSCAIKMATPLAVRAAMVESAQRGAVIKGGKFLEQLAKVDTVVLDKTGTLTEARPRVVEVCAVNGYSRDFILRNAACMEEHFPHPVAAAVVHRAEEEGLGHEERHAEVEYILAHGIATMLDGKRMILGSRHFVCDDEKVPVNGAEKQLQRCTEGGHSTLYMAVDGELAGVIALEDPLRPSAHRFIRSLEGMGMKRIIILTGDGEAPARAVAGELGIREFYAQALPEEKTALVDSLRAEGRTVAMVGDGINDSAALSRANVGISMKHGADIAREACDVMLTGDRLDSLVDAFSLSKRVMGRVKRNFGFIVGSNTLFIGLGISGLITPAMLALLHNSGTVLTCVNSMRPMLPGGGASSETGVTG